MDDLIQVVRDGTIATVVLNRPQKLNALTKAMWLALGEAIAALSADASLRCMILRGAGEKAFSPGNDIAEFRTERANKQQAIAYGKVMHATAQALDDCRHPLVAQIHGICVGGGLEIAALCDLRICGESSRFGAPIKNLGLVMAYPEMAPLLRLVGRDVALEILLEGRIFDAAGPKQSVWSRGWLLTTKWRVKHWQPHNALPRVHRSSRAGTRSSPVGSPLRAPLPMPSMTSVSIASTPKISGSATRLSWPSKSQNLLDDEHGQHRSQITRASRPACGHARARAGTDYGRSHLRHDACRPRRRCGEGRKTTWRR